MNPIVIGAAFFVFVMGAICAAGYFFVVRVPEAAGGGFEAGRLLGAVGEWVTSPHDPQEATRKLLAAAGYRGESAVYIFNGMRTATAVAGFLIVALVAMVITGKIEEAFVPALVGALIGYMFHFEVLKRKVKNRNRLLERGLPAAIDLYVLSLDAGQTMDQALLETSLRLRRSHPELAAEFAQVHAEARASSNRAAAFHDFADRTGDAEVRKIVTLLVDADRFGTGIGPALRTHAHYLRTRQRQAAYESARKVGVKLIFPVFFLIFPSVVLITLGPACIMVFTQLSDLLGR